MSLFAIDIMNLAYRCFHGVGDQQKLANSKGVKTWMFYGVAVQLEKLIKTYQPDYFAIATDLKVKTFRHDLYEAYKGNRGPAPEDFLEQLPNLYRMLDAYGFKVLKEPGFEADDLIGSLVTRFASKTQCVMVSADKDYMQLINENVQMLKPSYGGGWEYVNTEGVADKFDCLPSQVIDVLAIMGDTSDNVPGVKGIGEKGAAKLIKSFNTLEGVYENLGKTTPSICSKLIKSKDMAFLSKQLVTIKTDMDLDISLEDLKTPKYSKLESRKLFLEEMEFYSLLSNT